MGSVVRIGVVPIALEIAHDLQAVAGHVKALILERCGERGVELCDQLRIEPGFQILDRTGLEAA